MGGERRFEGVSNFDGQNCLDRIEIRTDFRPTSDRLCCGFATCVGYLYNFRVSDVHLRYKLESAILTKFHVRQGLAQQPECRILHVKEILLIDCSTHIEPSSSGSQLHSANDTMML